MAKFYFSGNPLKTIGGFGHGKDKFNQPHAITVDDSDHVIVADTGNHRLACFAPNLKFQLDLIDLDSDSITEPRGVTLDNSNNLIVSLYEENKIIKYKATEC